MAEALGAVVASVGSPSLCPMGKRRRCCAHERSSTSGSSGHARTAVAASARCAIDAATGFAKEATCAVADTVSVVVATVAATAGGVVVEGAVDVDDGGDVGRIVVDVAVDGAEVTAAACVGEKAVESVNATVVVAADALERIVAKFSVVVVVVVESGDVEVAERTVEPVVVGATPVVVVLIATVVLNAAVAKGALDAVDASIG